MTHTNAMLKGLGDQSPAKVAGLPARHLLDRQAAVLDSGRITERGVAQDRHEQTSVAPDGTV